MTIPSRSLLGPKVNKLDRLPRLYPHKWQAKKLAGPSGALVLVSAQEALVSDVVVVATFEMGLFGHGWLVE